MLRATVRASERTDVQGELCALRLRAERKGFTPAQVSSMVDQVGEALQTFVERGQALVAGGSQMSVDKTVAGTGYKVKISFQTGKRSGGFVAWLQGAFGR